MSMFASKTPRDLNHDPEPWQAPWPNLRRSEESRSPFNVHDRWEFKPRPEFDHVQHNEPNPILVKFRSGRSYIAFYWAYRLANGDLPVGITEASHETVDHARKVLTRLAALEAAVEAA